MQENYTSASSALRSTSVSSSGRSLTLPEADAMAQSSNATYIRPKTRQRVHKPPPVLDVPDINKDAGERKRVLNVLAQRRYSMVTRRARFPWELDDD